MITRDEIRSIPELNKSIQSDKERLRVLREKATSLPSMSDQERVQTSPHLSGNKYVEEAVDLNREIQKKEVQLVELQARASLFIYALPADTDKDKLTRKVLKYRYLRCYLWEEIANLLVYDIRWVQKIEDLATSKLD